VAEPKGGEIMPHVATTLDELVLEAVESGPVTVDDVLVRLERRVRERLEKLRRRGVLIREGRGGAHRKYLQIGAA
jgi:hypothetical protein